MVKVLLITQFIPLSVGILVRHWHPQVADRALRPFVLMSKILTLATASLILSSQWHMLMEIPIRAFLGMLILVVVCLVIGWLMGGSASADRKTMALTTALRNVGIGLVIVTGNYSGTPAVSAALTYGIVEVVLSLLIALWWGRISAQERLTMPN
jgi:BASS family bile acid:Na+ symporter